MIMPLILGHIVESTRMIFLLKKKKKIVKWLNKWHHIWSSSASGSSKDKEIPTRFFTVKAICFYLRTGTHQSRDKVILLVATITTVSAQIEFTTFPDENSDTSWPDRLETDALIWTVIKIRLSISKWVYREKKKIFEQASTQEMTNTGLLVYFPQRGW